MTPCHIQASAAIELYFYGEVSGTERIAVERHLTGCVECRRALEELTVIRTALDSRLDVSAPPGGDWSGFMTRLEQAVRAEAMPPHARSAAGIVMARPHGPVATALAMAALVALVTISLFVALRDRGASPEEPTAGVTPVEAVPVQAGSALAATDGALAQISEQHFERSKLVVLGLATRDSADSTADWTYERTLATSLLDDTRLYRQAAEGRGMKTLAGVMRDLELVLLQTSMSEKPDAESLAQLQRLIRRRDLIAKMEVVATTGLSP